MIAILISIQPQWVAKILNYIKKDEVRKGTAIGKAINKLIEEQGVAPMLIYCTKDKAKVCFDGCTYEYMLMYESDSNCDDNLNGKVVARFNATAEEISVKWDRYKEFAFYETSLDMEDLYKQSCLDYKELNSYLQGKKGTDIHINDLEIFDKPKELNEFYKVGYLEERYAVESHLADIEGCDGGVNESYADKLYEELDQEFQLTKAPQSWCYVEVELE